MGYRTQYFTYLWRHSCLSLRIHHGVSCTKPSTALIKSRCQKVLLDAAQRAFLSTESWNNLNLIICFVTVFWYVIVLYWILIIALSLLHSSNFCGFLVFTKRTLEEKQWQNYYFISPYISLEVTFPYLS